MSGFEIFIWLFIIIAITLLIGMVIYVELPKKRHLISPDKSHSICTLEEAIDLICDKISARSKDYYGIDIAIRKVIHLEDKLCAIFTKNGEVLTCEARFDDLSCFCWGESEGHHRAWVDLH